MINPERLLISAGRIYGELMDALWGQFLAVPEDRLTVLQDGDEVEIEGLIFSALDTPGHAYHHYCYLFEGTCFSGDVGGVRLQSPLPYLRLPTPPPEFDIASWRKSLKKMQAVGCERIAPTHFGIHHDPDWHLAALGREIDRIEQWMEAALPGAADREQLRRDFREWSLQICREAGMDDGDIHTYELAMPLGMGSDGLWRYWHKVLHPSL